MPGLGHEGVCRGDGAGKKPRAKTEQNAKGARFMRSELLFFAASFAVNTTILASFDGAYQAYSTQLEVMKQKKEAAQKLGSLQFEYIEAPPKESAVKPEKSSKVSDRDALSQDTTADKEVHRRKDPPKIDRIGPADQLEQRRLNPAALPSAASMPREASMGSEEKAAAEEPVPPSASAAENETDSIADPEKQSPKEDEPKESAWVPPAQASAAQAPKQGLTGQDRITTQMSARQKSHGAQMFGATSFEATGSGMGVYMKNLKEKIWLAWFPYLLFQYPRDFQTADVVVEFSLDRSGQVKAIKVVDQKGSPLFGSFCMEAIQRAAPFGPLPDELLALIGKEELEVQFSFHYW